MVDALMDVAESGQPGVAPPVVRVDLRAYRDVLDDEGLEGGAVSQVVRTDFQANVLRAVLDESCKN